MVIFFTKAAFFSLQRGIEITKTETKAQKKTFKYTQAAYCDLNELIHYAHVYSMVSVLLASLGTKYDICMVKKLCYICL